MPIPKKHQNHSLLAYLFRKKIIYILILQQGLCFFFLSTIGLRCFRAKEQITTSETSSNFSSKSCRGKCKELFLVHGLLPRLSKFSSLLLHNGTENNQSLWEKKEWMKCNCDWLFCTNDVQNKQNKTKITNTKYSSNEETSYSDSKDQKGCQWSPFSINILLSDLDPELCHTSNPHTQAFSPPPGWLYYQFGDMFKANPTVWYKAAEYMPRNSLGEAYYLASLAANATGDKTPEMLSYNYTLLCQLIEERILKYTRTNDTVSINKVNPNPNTLILHVRIGDVVDSAVDSVQDLLVTPPKYFYRAKSNQSGICCEYGNPQMYPNYVPFSEEWNQYVKPLFYYEHILPEFLSKHNQFSEMVVMGAAHQSVTAITNATKSCLYTHALQRWLQLVLRDRNMPINLRVGNLPDDDLIFATQAKGFIPSGGGYSKTIEHLRDIMFQS